MGRRRIAEKLWQALLILSFAVWWGGLTFYAMVVVPIGTQQIGSVEQGFITQKVTRWHNSALTIMTTCLLLEAWRRKRRTLWIVSGALAVINLSLLFSHSHLTAMLDFNNYQVSDNFYQAHAIYLWLTTVEWLLGLSVPLLVWQISPSESEPVSPSM